MHCISTCWNSSKHQDGYEMIKELIDIGYQNIELSHGLMLSLIPGIERALNEKLFKVCGIHNFCPSPVEVLTDSPDCYVFTSYKKEERKRAKDLTFKTIDYAQKVGGKYVVLHMGFVPIKKYSSELKQLVKDKKYDIPEYFDKKKELLQKRAKKAGIYFQRARDTLEELAEYAEKKEIKLGVESRNSFEEMPNEEEMTALMEEFKDNPWVGYWHDFGHVHIKHNLGLLDHPTWLKSMLPYLVGCHVHDVIYPAKDHHVPFAGGINFDELIPMVPKELPMVYEISSRRDKEDLIKSTKFWQTRYP